MQDKERTVEHRTEMRWCVSKLQNVGNSLDRKASLNKYTKRKKEILKNRGGIGETRNTYQSQAIDELYLTMIRTN